MIENIHNAAYLRRSEIVPRLNRTIIDKLEDVCRRGKEMGCSTITPMRWSYTG